MCRVCVWLDAGENIMILFSLTVCIWWPTGAAGNLTGAKPGKLSVDPVRPVLLPALVLYMHMLL